MDMTIGVRSPRERCRHRHRVTVLPTLSSLFVALIAWHVRQGLGRFGHYCAYVSHSTRIASRGREHEHARMVLRWFLLRRLLSTGLALVL